MLIDDQLNPAIQEFQEKNPVKRHRYDPARCVGCGLCVQACPAAAIDMVETAEYREPAASFKRLAVRLAPAKIMAMIKGKIMRK